MIFLYFLISFKIMALTPDWSEDYQHPGRVEEKFSSINRKNIYNIPEELFNSYIINSRRHALIYPVNISDLLIPYEPLITYFESSPEDPIRKLIFNLTQKVSPFKSMNDLYDWLGLHPFPKNLNDKKNPNPLPKLSKSQTMLPMGATLINSYNATGLTFGCAACHSGNLFGTPVLGLTNRFPRPNEFFRHGKSLFPYVNTFLFKNIFNSTEDERLMLKRSKITMPYVEAKEPQVLGLDTSLAQVALSLRRRGDDEYASKNILFAKFPKKNGLQKKIADSKPAVWWNLKYKTRWLSDGSIVSGNPIHTNFLWNEIGRGTDLVKLEKWLKQNTKTIEELTAAVFATQAPRWEAFFPNKKIDLKKAKLGQSVYINHCQKCHGIYEKAWDELPTEANWMDQIQTTKVLYHRKTPVIDVGTDSGRYEGMQYFYKDLNRLKISKEINALVKPQKGYVPPPLDGIWARWPYFHNNSIPNLCVLLTRGQFRPKSYWAHEANNTETDYDSECVGYPTGSKTPKIWMKNKNYFYDTTKEGLSNRGHDEKIFLKDGKEILQHSDKINLIEFLKTL